MPSRAQCVSLMTEEELKNLTHDYYLNLSLCEDTCMRHSYINAGVITLSCDEELSSTLEVTLIIDAPNVIEFRTEMELVHLDSISYLPSLKKCEIQSLRFIYDLLTPEMKQRVDEAEEQYITICESEALNHYYPNKEVLDQAEEEFRRVYLECYHELHACSKRDRQGMLLPPRSARCI